VRERKVIEIAEPSSKAIGGGSTIFRRL
jgi:hypothetical protein